MTRDPLPVVNIDLPRCPHCESTWLFRRTAKPTRAGHSGRLRRLFSFVSLTSRKIPTHTVRAPYSVVGTTLQNCRPERPARPIGAAQ